MERKIHTLIICFILAGMLLVSGCSKMLETVDNTEVVFVYNEPQTTTAAAVLPTGNSYVVNKNETILRLISSFYEYLKEGDYQSAKLLVDDSAHFSSEAFEKKSEYIAGLDNIECYVMEGMIDKAYIVVASSNVYTAYGEAPVTMLEAFYCIENDNGSMYICTGSIGDEVKSYNSIMLSDSKIQKLIEDVAQANEELLTINEEFGELKGILIPETLFRFAYEL